jgi:hypothetical protein
MRGEGCVAIIIGGTHNYNYFNVEIITASVLAYRRHNG